MVRRLTATVDEAFDCPLFDARDRMSFELPELVADDSNRLCAIAVADLLPSILRVAAGGRAPSTPLACRGCRAGRAQARFRVAIEHSDIDEATREAMMPILARIPLFKGLSERRLEKVLAVVNVLEFQPGETLLECNRTEQPLYIVTEGTVDILTPNDKGELGRVASLGAGECVGEMSLLTGDPTSAAVRSATPVRALRITKPDFDRLLDATPALNVYFSKLLAQRLKTTSSQLLDDLSNDHDISGDLSMLSCPEIVQAINATNRTGRLELDRQDADDTLAMVFDQGRIIRLETDITPPEESFFEALGWQRGSFRFKVIDPGDVEQNVYLDTMGLLLEGMRRLDDLLNEPDDPLSALDAESP